MELADKIRKIREEQRITQADMARALSIDPAAYFRLEKRGEKLSIDQLTSIAKILGVTPASLLEAEPTENPVLDQEVRQLRERNKELEERVSDKQSLLDSIQNGKFWLASAILDNLFTTSIELGMITKQEERKDNQGIKWTVLNDYYGLTSTDDKGEKVLHFDPQQVLTADDLRRVYNHLYQTSKDYWRLLLLSEIHLNVLTNGLAKDTLQEFTQRIIGQPFTP